MPVSKYIRSKVQDLFGINAKDRFMLMCTFADDKPPKCISTLPEDFRYEKHFVFNNSAINTPSHIGTSTTKFFWKMAMNSIKIFSEYIIDKN